MLHKFVRVIVPVQLVGNRKCNVLITSSDAMQYAISAELNDPGYAWGITSCNKQYVHDEANGKYLGCMANVTEAEAYAWNREAPENWYISDPETGELWMPVKRNPNKIIPTRYPLEKASAMHAKPQHRPWPLHATSYEEWRDEIVNKMIKTLDEAL